MSEDEDTTPIDNTVDTDNVDIWSNERPEITDGKVGYTPLGLGAAPDGDISSARIGWTPDGFHFEPSDFSDFVFGSISISSPNGDEHTISYSDDGVLLIDDIDYVPPTNQDDETIKGNKNYEGQTKLSGGLQLPSPNGTIFNIVVGDDGKLTTEKEEDNGTTNENVQQSGSKP